MEAEEARVLEAVEVVQPKLQDQRGAQLQCLVQPPIFSSHFLRKVSIT